MKSPKKKLVTSLIATALLVAGTVETAYSAESMAETKKVLEQQLMMMTPELRKRVVGLSPATKKELMKIINSHDRRSDSLTLLQVMQEVLADYQSVIAALVVENGEQAADAARRLANHRLPRGGLLPYMRIEDVNDAKLGTLVAFNDSVEGNAKRLAKAAEAGDMNKAASYLSDITAGCIACHEVFRGKPGTTTLLK